MTSVNDLSAGLTAEAAFKVTNKDTAPHLESGELAVLATPRMVAWVERTCAELAERYLSPGQSTVGVQLQVEHVAPTPVGVEVQVSVELLDASDQRLSFSAQVYNEIELIGKVVHQRVIIDRQRFMKRVESKVS